MNNSNLNLQDVDIADKALISTKEAANILGLKYHCARNMLYNDISIGCVNYGCKKLWVKDEILEYKRKHYIKPVMRIS